MVAGKAAPAEVLQKLVARTDGVPLFVEELTKMVVELGWLREREEHYELTGPLPPLAIPTTLHDSLMARLDRLGSRESRWRNWGRGGGARVWLRSAPGGLACRGGGVQQGLAQLVRRRIALPAWASTTGIVQVQTCADPRGGLSVVAAGAPGDSTTSRLSRYWRQRSPETCKTHPELMAHHYTEAGLHGAGTSLLAAGRSARH